jgi:hypothetical protein
MFLKTSGQTPYVVLILNNLLHYIIPQSCMVMYVYVQVYLPQNRGNMLKFYDKNYQVGVMLT